MKRRSSVVVPILVAALSFALAAPASAGVIVDRALDDALPGAALSASPIMGSLSADTDPLDAYATAELHPGDSIGATLTCEAGVDFRLRLLRPGATSLDDSAAIVAEGVSVNHGVAATGTYTLVARAVSGSGWYSIVWSVSERVDRPGHLVATPTSFTVTQYLDQPSTIGGGTMWFDNVGGTSEISRRTDRTWLVTDDYSLSIRRPSTVPGTYLGHVIFEAADAANSPLEVLVTYHLLPRRAAVRLSATFPSVVTYPQVGTVRGTMTDSAGRPLGGIVELQDGEGTRIRGIRVVAGRFAAPLALSTDEVLPRYRIGYRGTTRYAWAATAYRNVQYRPMVTAPYVPQLVHTYVTYRMTGAVRPPHPAAVRIELQRYYGGRWLVEDTLNIEQEYTSYALSYRPVGWHEGRARVRAVDMCERTRVYSPWRYFTIID